MRCGSCGSELDGKVFCGKCGAKNVMPDGSTVQETPKKKNGCLIAIIVFLVVIAALVASAFIFIPKIFSGKNLGVKVNEKAYESAMEKMKYEKDDFTMIEDSSLVNIEYGPTNPIKDEFSDEEFSSYLTYNRPQDYWLQKVKTTFNEDGSIESTATIDVNYVLNELTNGEISADEILDQLPIKISLPKNLKIYTDVDCVIKDNKVSYIDVHDAKIMGISLDRANLDKETVNDAAAFAINTYLSFLNNRSDTFYDSVENVGGMLDIEGDIPSYAKIID